MRILFEVAGDKLIERNLLRVGNRAVDAAPAFEAVADLMMTETRQQFGTEGRHASGGWKPLKPATLAAKRRKGQDPRILRATGALERSLTSRGDSSQLLEIGPDSLRFGSTLPYAAVHQNPRPGNPLPQRRPLAFTEAAKREIVKIVQRYLVEELAA